MIANATPVTVITGFLGSGKTTLINRLLAEAHGRRFAVIENEYGAVDVDSELLVKDRGEVVVQLTNGCVCCTVRGDLANALHALGRRRDAGEIAFDHVLIEPTGLADPGPIVRTFMAETELLARFFLDGVVTLFDGLHGVRSVAESGEAQAQLACADRVLVTKADLLAAQGPEALEEVIAFVHAANAVADVAPIDLPRADWGEVFDRLLDLRGYQFDRVAPACPAQPVTHLREVGTVIFEAGQALDGVRLNQALAAINARYGESLWRVKGVLAIEGLRSRVVVQGVQGLLQANPATLWRPFEPRRSRLVLIGRALDRDWILARLREALPDTGVDH
jgi:G3E family GTPase